MTFTRYGIHWQIIETTPDGIIAQQIGCETVRLYTRSAG